MSRGYNPPNNVRRLGVDSHVRTSTPKPTYVVTLFFFALFLRTYVMARKLVAVRVFPPPVRTPFLSP